MLNETQECVVGALKEEKLDPLYFQAMVAPYNKTTLPTWEIALKVAFYLVAMLVDLVGNSIVILIVVLNRNMRTTTNTLIANLAISDLMVACFCMWAHVGNNITKNWPFGEIVCKVNTFFQILAVTSSVLTLMIIAVERFYAVVFPFKRNWSTTITGLVILASWVVSLCTAFPQLIVRKEEVIRWQDRTDRWCEEAWPAYYVDTGCNSEAPGKMYYYIVVGLVMYFLPILVMLFTYSIIACRLLRRRHPGRRPSGGRMSTQDRAKRKVTKMLVMVLFIFIVCWSPQQVIMMYDHLNPNKESPDYLKPVRYVALYMAYACSAINPILYAGLNENFRRGFLEAFRCLLVQRRNRIDPDGSITRSRASTRRENAHPDRSSARQALEAKELQGVANGLGDADHTMAETMELSESPQDTEEQNQLRSHDDSGDGAFTAKDNLSSLDNRLITEEAMSIEPHMPHETLIFNRSYFSTNTESSQEMLKNQNLPSSPSSSNTRTAITSMAASAPNLRVSTDSKVTPEFISRNEKLGRFNKSHIHDFSTSMAFGLLSVFHISQPVISESEKSKTFELISCAPFLLSENPHKSDVLAIRSIEEYFDAREKVSDYYNTVATYSTPASRYLNTEPEKASSDNLSVEEFSACVEPFLVEGSERCHPLNVEKSDHVRVLKGPGNFPNFGHHADVKLDLLVGSGDKKQASTIVSPPDSKTGLASYRGGLSLMIHMEDSDLCKDNVSTDL